MSPYVKFRPVNSQCGSLSAIISKYVNYYLQLLTKFISSYTKNSKHVIHKLKYLNTLPPGTQITTSDALSMYTNIDPKEGIDTVEKYTNLYNKEYKGHLPKELIIKIICLIMTKNVLNLEILGGNSQLEPQWELLAHVHMQLYSSHTSKELIYSLGIKKTPFSTCVK